MRNRFQINYDNKGNPIYNEYIGKIAIGVQEYRRRKHIYFLNDVDKIYEQICNNRKMLEIWEGLLKKEGVL